jgi:hypothetical protein
MQSIALAREAVASGTLSVATKYRMQKEWGIMKPVVKLVQDKSWYWVIEQDYDSQVVRETSQTNLNWVISHVTMWIILRALYWSEASVARIDKLGWLLLSSTVKVWSYTEVFGDDLATDASDQYNALKIIHIVTWEITQFRFVWLVSLTTWLS